MQRGYWPKWLAAYGETLLNNGYNITPIRKGGKRPAIKDWESNEADSKLLKRWLKSGFGENGIGIVTGKVIAVDIDVLDEGIAKELEDWCHMNIGMAPVRVGQAPKRLLVYRTDEPFPKITSRSFDNPALPDVEKNGRMRRPRNRIEVLADGQQFVAFAIHPDTGKPFEWLHGESLLDIPFDNLPIITSAQARELVETFEELAIEVGWEQMGSTSLTTLSEASRAPEFDHDDPFAADVEKVEISDHDLHAKLLMVPGADDYDIWLQVGMALYHQYDGEDRGLELWHAWSSDAENYDPDALDDKWRTFDISEKGRTPVTARTIIKLANEAAERLVNQTLKELRKALDGSQTIAEIKEVAQRIKKTELDVPTREQMVGMLRSRFKVVTGQTLGIQVARDMLRYENPEVRNTPRWLQGWVYVSSEDKFFNTYSKELMTQTAFNSAHARMVLTKKDVLEGRSHPEQLPSNLALNVHQVPIVSARRYCPGLDEVFTMAGVSYANMYTDRNVPDIPDKLTERDKRNIEIVKHHFTHLFPDERESRIFMDYIAYIVQNPDKRPGWAVLIQGTEGDGKTFFGELLGVMLGSDNVRMLSPKTIQSDFNGWAEGQQVVFVEEIRLQGHNRYDILNQVKPLITNNVIEIHRKGVDPYNIPNTSSYILATNYRDALPLTENDSRYFVLFSRFQTLFSLKKFRESHPDYYADLYDAISESPGALLSYFLNHEISDWFSVGNRAPESKSKEYMTMLTKSEEQQAIEYLLENSMRLDISRQLLNVTALTDELHYMDVDVPYGRSMNTVLSNMGFTYLGRVKVDGNPVRFWSQEPDRFIENGSVRNDLIRNWAETDL